jgi:hypothetical protein
MRKIFTALAIVLLLVSSAQATSFTVSADPLWTNTGIVLGSTDVLVVSNAQGSWTWGVGMNGPAGYNLGSNGFYDEWITNGKQGQLIAFVGNVAPGTVGQNDPRLFAIGSNTIKTSGYQGTLWLGFNDAWNYPGFVGDNFGFVTANVTVNGQNPVPEPLSIALVGSGLGLLGLCRRRKK